MCSSIVDSSLTNYVRLEFVHRGFPLITPGGFLRFVAGIGLVEIIHDNHDHVKWEALLPVSTAFHDGSVLHNVLPKEFCTRCPIVAAHAARHEVRPWVNEVRVCT